MVCPLFSPVFSYVIYNFSFVEHLINPQKVFREFNRILKIGGELIITTPNIESFTAKRFKGNYRLLGAPHVILWSPKTIRIILETNNFEIVKICYPFFKTDFFTLKNITRLWNKKKVSPPFYGNMMSIYCKKIKHI